MSRFWLMGDLRQGVMTSQNVLLLL